MAKSNDSKPQTTGTRNGTATSVKPSEQKSTPAGGNNYPGGRRLTPKQEAARRRAQKRRRIQLLVTSGVVLVLVVAVIIIAYAVSRPTNFVNIPAAATVDQRPFELGPADAKVTVDEYGDYQCPYCAIWHSSTQPQFVNDYITAGKSVKFVFKPYPFLDARSAQRESHLTVEAAYCAADQNRFWDYHNALYNNQPKDENSGFWTSDRLKELAKALKLDTSKFNSCLDGNTYRAKANADAAAAVSAGITGTPSFVVNGTIITSQNYSDLQKAIDEALNSPTK